MNTDPIETTPMITTASVSTIRHALQDRSHFSTSMHRQALQD